MVVVAGGVIVVIFLGTTEVSVVVGDVVGVLWDRACWKAHTAHKPPPFHLHSPRPCAHHSRSTRHGLMDVSFSGNHFINIIK